MCGRLTTTTTPTTDDSRRTSCLVPSVVCCGRYWQSFPVYLWAARRRVPENTVGAMPMSIITSQYWAIMNQHKCFFYSNAGFEYKNIYCKQITIAVGGIKILIDQTFSPNFKKHSKETLNTAPSASASQTGYRNFRILLLFAVLRGSLSAQILHLNQQPEAAGSRNIKANHAAIAGPRRCGRRNGDATCYELMFNERHPFR